MYTEAQVKDMIAEAIAQTLSTCGYDGGPEFEEDNGLTYDEFVDEVTESLLK